MIAFVVTRFFLKLAILISFSGLAVLRGQSLYPALTTLCTLAAGFCIGLAAIHREQIFQRSPTHWDEAAAFLLMACTGKMLS
jgi:hypothetical protein